jgi:hypothetical protein
MNNLIKLFNFSSIFKIGFLAVDLMFIIFLLVVIKQVFSMNTIVHDINDSAIIKSGSVILFVFALSLFLAALAIL